jgi:PDDEXK-like domain of unknown function (DUF3799)
VNAGDYFSSPGINWSSLKHMLASPMAYRHALQSARADTEAFAIGRAVHCLVLEPDAFDDQFIVWDGGRRYGKEWDAFRDAANGATIIRAQDAEFCRAIAGAVCGSPLAAQYLSGGVVEHIVRWTDPETGLACKAKIDLINDGAGLLLDLKTTTSIDGRRFGAEAARYHYQLQLAHYAAGCAHGLGWAPSRVVILAVEKTAPFDVGVFALDSVAMQIAADEVAGLLRRVKECTENGIWPGRYSEEQALQLPAWVYTADDAEDEGDLGLILGE